MVDVIAALEVLVLKKNSIISELQACETYYTALDEMERSILFLKTVDFQTPYFRKCRVSYASVFLPLNQPLYSFFLQVFSLALICDRVVFRPPHLLQTIYQNIYKHFQKCFDNIEIFCGTRKDFFDNYVNKSEVVNFVGKYENALSIARNIRADQLMAFNGSAINPIVIDSDANIDISSTAVVKASFYNSGQDCMAPGMIFINDSISDSFIASLKEKVNSLHVGEYSDLDSEIGPLISKPAFIDAINFIHDSEKQIITGGKYDVTRMIIYPTVFFNDDCSFICEKLFYAPFIISYSFREIGEVTEYLKSSYAQIYKGYVSYFGYKNKALFTRNKNLPLLLHNSTLLEYEHPIKEFGGYGEGCSFISVNDRITAKPILLLREICEWKNKRIDGVDYD